MEIETPVELRNGAQNSNDNLNETGINAPNLYIEPPVSKISLEEAEDLFRQRLEAMAIVETQTQRDTDTLPACLKAIKTNAFKVNCVGLSLKGEQIKHDNIAHFLARLYFSTYPEDSDLCKRFKAFERKLLNLRLRDIDCFSADKLASFLNQFDFEFELVPRVEVLRLAEENYIGFNKLDGSAKKLDSVFKVKFEHALNFVTKRSVALKDGFALLTSREIKSVLCDVFANHLDESMRFMRGTLSLNEQEKYLMESLDLVYADFKCADEERRKRIRTEDDPDRNPFSIVINNVDHIVSKHYPPCMRHIHEALRQNHHLRHQGRVHYGTFLRSCGVDMESAIEFWRDEFTKKIPNDKFERDYKYNIRHLYGKEGHKKALTSFSCDKIIKDNPPGPMDSHGCPFKHFDEKNLRNLLKKYGLSEVDSDSIVFSKKQQDYTRACSDYFKFTHGDLPSEPIRNPAQYYYESMRFEMRPPQVDEVIVEDVAGVESKEPKDLEVKELSGIELLGIKPEDVNGDFDDEPALSK